MDSIHSRINKIKGQIEGIEKMISQSRECPQVLQQITAVRAALGQLAIELLKDETKCLMELKEKDKYESLDKLFKSIYKVN